MADFSNIENQIDSAITTNGVGAITGAILNAILKGMLSAVDTAKEDTLTFDLTPTEDSTKPVTSGGVYDALEAAAQAVATALTDYYTKTQADNLLSAKADDADVVHLTGNETIAGVKTFSVSLVTTGSANFNTGATVKAGLDIADTGISMNGTKVEDLGTPTYDTDAANKKYVDDGLAAKQDTLTVDAVPTDGSDNPVASNGVYDALALKADDADVVHTTGSETVRGVKDFRDGILVQQGIGCNGNITMNSHTVKGLATPTADAEAATKKYVDDGLSAKQDTISDLATIRSGAAAGATAVQPATMQTALDGKADKVAKATTQPAGGFAPNTYYALGELSGDTTFTMAAATDSTILNVWYWTFDTPATAPTITWPAEITDWVGGSAPTIAASKRYEISVVDGVGAYIEA